MGDASSVRGAGFAERTLVEDALDRLLEATTVSPAVDTVPLADADGRVIAESVTASRNVPDFPRAAMDGYAVRAADTFGAAERSPVVLETVEEDPAPGQATWVHTGSPVPEAADAVVKVEYARELDGEIEVTDAVAAGENVSAVGEDLSAGQELYEPGHRLRPSDLALLRSVEVESVEVYDPPEVAVVPTGEELVASDPGPGEAIETNGIMVGSLAERWGATTTRHDVVTDDPETLSAALEDARSADVVVTTGGSSIGERDYLPSVVEDDGELLVHGVALKPGHPVALGALGETPVLMLPGYPVACIVNAWQFLRPVVHRAAGAAPDEPSTVRARLGRKIRSEPGVRSCVRVNVEREDGEVVANPVHESGASILSSVALSDGWVQVPEPVEGRDVGETVTVEFWEAHP